MRQLGRNALWTSLCCLVLSTGVHFLATVVDGPLAGFALAACTASAGSVPFVVGKFREVYLPLVSPSKYQSKYSKRERTGVGL